MHNLLYHVFHIVPQRVIITCLDTNKRSVLHTGKATLKIICKKKKRTLVPLIFKLQIYRREFILSRASEAGSPTSPLGSGQRQDRGPGILNYLYKNFKKKRTVHLIRLFLLRQGEPSTSQYKYPDNQISR